MYKDDGSQGTEDWYSKHQLGQLFKIQSGSQVCGQNLSDVSLRTQIHLVVDLYRSSYYVRYWNSFFYHIVCSLRRKRINTNRSHKVGASGHFRSSQRVMGEIAQEW